MKSELKILFRVFSLMNNFILYRIIMSHIDTFCHLRTIVDIIWQEKTECWIT